MHAIPAQQPRPDDASPSIAAALAAAVRTLQADCPSAQLDAELLLGYVLNKPRSWLIGFSDHNLTADQQARFSELIRRRVAGEPVAYLLGRQAFWTLDLMVDTATLVPRPETELLVELALERIPRQAAWTIADLGTGSGAIALALATERPHCTVIASDVSPAAIAVARRNAARLQVENIRFHTGGWLPAHSRQHLDLVVSNPPYIAHSDPHLRGDGVCREPPHALAAGPDGLAALRQIAKLLPRQMAPGAWLLLEHGFDQSRAVAELLVAQGFEAVSAYRDLAGHARVCAGRRPT